MDPTFGTVFAQDPDNYGVLVTLDGPFGQSGPTIPVIVGTHGPRDAVRGNYPELPIPGQRGVIIFPRNDHRNAVWLCAIPSALNDSNPNVAGALPAHTELAYGGGVFWRGPDGSEFTEYPDGSILQVGPSQPTLTRHTVNPSQVRSATPFPLAQRRTRAPAGSFAFSYTQAGTGASMVLTASGAWVFTAAPGQTFTMQVSGGASVVLANTTVVLTASSEIELETPSSITSGELTVSGTPFTPHTHPNSSPNTGPPNAGT